MKKVFLFFLLAVTQICYSNTLKDRLVNTQPGDFFVLKQKKMITIIRVVDIKPSKLVIEEISAPISVVPSLDWQKWILNNAPGSTSWILFEIDLTQNEIVETFSFTRMAWLESSKQDNFLVQMLESQLEKTPKDKLKKVGPPPLSDEIDRRAIWIPPMIVHGKKIKSPSYDVFLSIWPNDSSELAGKRLQLYFDKEKKFFFPFWIELIGDHLSISLKVIDAGHNLISPKKDILYRPLEFFLDPKLSEEGLSFYLKCPKYYKELEVFALNYLDETKQFQKLAYQKKNIQNEKIEIFIDSETLKSSLQDNTYYIWYIKPNNSKTVLEWKIPLLFK